MSSIENLSAEFNTLTTQFNGFQAMMKQMLDKLSGVEAWWTSIDKAFELLLQKADQATSRIYMLESRPQPPPSPPHPPPPPPPLSSLLARPPPPPSLPDRPRIGWTSIWLQIHRRANRHRMGSSSTGTISMNTRMLAEGSLDVIRHTWSRV